VPFLIQLCSGVLEWATLGNVFVVGGLAVTLLARKRPPRLSRSTGDGAERSAWIRRSAALTGLRCGRTRLALCGNGIKSFELRGCRGQRVGRVTDVQEPSDKQAADNGPVRSGHAAQIIERD
jgi:hypothetical protein